MRRSLYLLFGMLALLGLCILSWRALSPRPAERILESSSFGSTRKSVIGQSEPNSLQRTKISTSSISLDDWRQRLKTMPESEAVKAIQAFLRTGQDSAAHQPFALGPDGHLTSAPTLRTFLLDELGKRDQAAAAQVGERILKESSSPDE